MKIDTTGIETDIDRETARRAFYNTSFRPEKRGDDMISGYIEIMQKVAETIEAEAQDDR